MYQIHKNIKIDFYRKQTIIRMLIGKDYYRVFIIIMVKIN